MPQSSSSLPLASLALAALLAAARAQQPEQAHLAYTGKAGELSLDFMAHGANCSLAWGAQVGTTPDFSAGEFVAAYACDDFTAQESTKTLAVRVLLQGLVAGTTYYYVCGSEDSRSPWSQVYSFAFQSGAAREGGPVYAIVADFGYYNAESLERLTSEAYDGKFDTLLHAGDFAYNFQDDAGRVGDGYMRQLAPVISSMPYSELSGAFVTLGYLHRQLLTTPLLEPAVRLPLPPPLVSQWASRATTRRPITTLTGACALRPSPRTPAQTAARVRSCSTPSTTALRTSSCGTLRLSGRSRSTRRRP